MLTAGPETGSRRRKKMTKRELNRFKTIIGKLAYSEPESPAPGNPGILFKGVPLAKDEYDFIEPFLDCICETAFKFSANGMELHMETGLAPSTARVRLSDGTETVYVDTSGRALLFEMLCEEADAFARVPYDAFAGSLGKEEDAAEPARPEEPDAVRKTVDAISRISREEDRRGRRGRKGRPAAAGEP